jgi:pimeloyl-ACP methyl ester carboxylesterase
MLRRTRSGQRFFRRVCHVQHRTRHRRRGRLRACIDARRTSWAHRWGTGPEVVFLRYIARGREPVALVGWSQGAALAQQVARTSPERVRAAALLATYGRQNEIDRILQESWDILADGGADSLRLALSLLTAFPPDRLADDSFVRSLREAQSSWAGPPDPHARRRAATFISTYQDRLQDLAAITIPSPYSNAASRSARSRSG